MAGVAHLIISHGPSLLFSFPWCISCFQRINILQSNKCTLYFFSLITKATMLQEMYHYDFLTAAIAELLFVPTNQTCAKAFKKSLC